MIGYYKRRIMWRLNPNMILSWWRGSTNNTTSKLQLHFLCLSVLHHFFCHLHHYLLISPASPCNICLLCPQMKQCILWFHVQNKWNSLDLKSMDEWTKWLKLENIKSITCLPFSYVKWNKNKNIGINAKYICASIYIFHYNILQTILTAWQGNAQEWNK